MLDDRITFDVARLTGVIVPATRVNWSTVFWGLVMLLGFGWWTWDLRHTSGSWWWLATAFGAFCGFAAIMGSKQAVRSAASEQSGDEQTAAQPSDDHSAREQQDEDAPSVRAIGR